MPIFFPYMILQLFSLGRDTASFACHLRWKYHCSTKLPPDWPPSLSRFILHSKHKPPRLPPPLTHWALHQPCPVQQFTPKFSRPEQPLTPTSTLTPSRTYVYSLSVLTIQLQKKNSVCLKSSLNLFSSFHTICLIDANRLSKEVPLCLPFQFCL